jgi:cytoskeletal protein CcmA (bactofilin family)
VARRDRPIKSGQIDTVIGAGTVLEGNIEAQSGVRVDGKLKGDLKTEGDVAIGAGAAIAGTISANNVVLAGRVNGNIYAEGMLRLLAGARLHGNVQAKGLVTDEGGIFHGKCNIVEERSPVQKQRAASTDGEPVEKGPRGRAALRRAKSDGEGAES